MNRRPRLTYANVMSTIAVFLAASTGGAYAAQQIVLKKNQVRSVHIKNGQVTLADLHPTVRKRLTAPPKPVSTTWTNTTVIRTGDILLFPCTGPWCTGRPDYSFASGDSEGVTEGFTNIADISSLVSDTRNYEFRLRGRIENQSDKWTTVNFSVRAGATQSLANNIASTAENSFIQCKVQIGPRQAITDPWPCEGALSGPRDGKRMRFVRLGVSGWGESVGQAPMGIVADMALEIRRA